LAGDLLVEAAPATALAVPLGAALTATGRAADFFWEAVFAGVLDFFAAVPADGVAGASAAELEQINVKSAMRSRVG